MNGGLPMIFRRTQIVSFAGERSKPNPILLWPNGAPLAQGDSDAEIPDQVSKKVKELRWAYLLSTIGLVFVMAGLINSVVFPLPIWQSVFAFSRGTVQATLVVNLASFLVFYTWLRPAGIRPNSLGFGPGRQVLQGLMGMLVFWVLVQLAVIMSARLKGLAVNFNPQVNPQGGALPYGFWGLFLSQALGNALYEEAVFRGFLIPQFFLKCRRFLPARVAPSVFLGAVLSLAIFDLYHLPNLICRNLPLAFLVYPLIGGSLYTLLYLETGNLVFVIGVHALGNAPTLLWVRDPSAPDWSYSLVGAACVIAIPLICRRQRRWEVAVGARCDCQEQGKL